MDARISALGFPSDDVTADTLGRCTIVIPARNEAVGLGHILPELHSRFPTLEILVVDDGSTDETTEVCRSYGVRVVSHAYSMGNGAAVKTGAREARGEILITLDADGQHDPADVPRLVEKYAQGYQMVVGARVTEPRIGAGSHRNLANALYNRFASWMVGHRVADLTSGFRVVDAAKFRKFLYLLPNGFSYPTTITMSFFRSGYAVGYVPITAGKREGNSHVRLLRDGVRFLLIIFKIGVLYSPMKLFFPVSASLLFGGLANYIHTYLTDARFTNMSTLLLLAGLITFLVGLVSEQITSLNFRDSEEP
jgi:glycosyltransferase involved in cell wall biosynthesis